MSIETKRRSSKIVVIVVVFVIVLSSCDRMDNSPVSQVAKQGDELENDPNGNQDIKQTNDQMDIQANEQKEPSDAAVTVFEDVEVTQIEGTYIVEYLECTYSLAMNELYGHVTNIAKNDNGRYLVIELAEISSSIFWLIDTETQENWTIGGVDAPGEVVYYPVFKADSSCFAFFGGDLGSSTPMLYDFESKSMSYLHEEDIHEFVLLKWVMDDTAIECFYSIYGEYGKFSLNRYYLDGTVDYESELFTIDDLNNF